MDESDPADENIPRNQPTIQLNAALLTSVLSETFKNAFAVSEARTQKLLEAVLEKQPALEKQTHPASSSLDATGNVPTARTQEVRIGDEAKHHAHVKSLLETTTWGLQKLRSTAGAKTVYKYFRAITEVLRQSSFTSQKSFTCGDFVDGSFDADTYDAMVWHTLEIVCQLTLPASLRKESAKESLLAVQRRAGFDQRLQRLNLLRDLRAEAAALTGFERIDAFEQLEIFRADLSISYAESLALEALETAPKIVWD